MSRVEIPKFPVNLSSKEFSRDKYEHYRWMLEEAPVCKGKMSVLPITLVAPYAVCRDLLKDPRFVRNRATATGGRAFPFPIPRSIEMMMKGLITQDDPNHKRQRSLVAKAFTPRALGRLEDRVGEVVTELLDGIEGQKEVNLLESFCLPLPVTIIQEMLGVRPEDMPRFQNSLSALTDGLNGLTMLRTMMIDMPKTIRFVEELLEAKRKDPADDILTGLLQAEEGDDRLSHDELVAMTLTLVIAGYETTVHLIGNAAVTLLTHPEELDKLRADPTLIDSAIEEVMRFNGPIHGTKPHFATEDLELLGVPISRGAAVFPLLGAANRDPAQFDDPETFDITRSPNKQIGFGYGIHHCLGAALARIEARAAIGSLVERAPNLSLAIPAEDLRVQFMPMWHRYEAIPVNMA